MSGALRSQCCRDTVVFQHPQTRLYVAANNYDPTYQQAVMLDPTAARCYACNGPALSVAVTA